MLGGYQIVDDDFYRLTAWLEFFRKTGNQYLNKRLAKENRKLWSDMDDLKDFIATNFFALREQNPHNKSQYLKPDWNPERGDDPSPEKVSLYYEYAKELTDLTKKVIKQYAIYRLSVRQSLKI